MTVTLTQQLFPFSAGRPIRRPRFGNVPPPAPVDVPASSTDCSGSAPVQPLDLDWADPELGLKVRVRQRESGEVWALVDSPHAHRQNEIVPVALVGPSQGKLKPIPVKLTKQNGEGWSGSASFGSVEELRKNLGSPLTVIAFVLSFPEKETAEPPKDLDLVRAIQDGSLAFDTLVNRHHDNLVRSLHYSLTGDWQKAEDAAQAAWIAMRRILFSSDPARGFQPSKASFRTLLYRLAYRAAVTHHRQLRNEAPPTDDEVIDRQTGDDDDPVFTVTRPEDAAIVQKAIAGMPEIYRSVLMLRIVEGLSGKEVAEVLEINEITVGTRLHSAKRLLRKKLEELGFDPS
jgi:RNA polymerase sigma-70 factor (ECF subfamily)